MDCTTIGSAATGREITETEIEDLYKVLASVTDGRCKRGRRYEAADLLTAMMLAKLAGEEAWSGIAQWVRLRLTWLQQVIPLPKAPCANCYRYLCERIDAMELNAKVAEFFTGQAGEEGGDGATATANDADSAVGSVASMCHWACDGKELRGTYRLVHGERQRAQGVFCVYDVSHAYTQALLPIESKGFEQAVFRQWLHTTQLSGCVVTADALHTHPAVCRGRGSVRISVYEGRTTLWPSAADGLWHRPQRRGSRGPGGSPVASAVPLTPVAGRLCLAGSGWTITPRSSSYAPQRGLRTDSWPPSTFSAALSILA